MSYCKCESKDCKYLQSAQKYSEKESTRDPCRDPCDGCEKSICDQFKRGCAKYAVKFSGENFWEPTSAPPISDNFYALMSGDVTNKSAIVSVANDTVAPLPLKLEYAEKDCNGIWRRQDPTDAVLPIPNTSFYKFNLTNLKSDTEYNFYASTIISTPVLNITEGLAAGNYPGEQAFFGPSIWPNGNFEIVPAISNNGENFGVAPIVTDLTGKFALISRGEIAFVTKVQNAQDNGAVGVIVTNNNPFPPIRMGGFSDTINIPSLMISQADGDIIRNALESEQVSGKVNIPARSSIGRFKTAPSDRSCPKKIRFGLSSCNGFRVFTSGEILSYTDTNNLLKMPTEDLDFHIHMGDFAYNDDTFIQSEDPFPGRPNFVRNTIAFGTDFATRPPIDYQGYLSGFKLMAFDSNQVTESIKSTSMFYIQDNHEIFENIKRAPLIKQLTTGPGSELALLLEDYGLPADLTQNDWGQFWGLPNYAADMINDALNALDTASIQIKDNGKRYFKRSWGNTADFIFMDLINDRTDLRYLLSPEQMNFVKTSLKESTAPFKFLITSEPISNGSAETTLGEDYLDFVAYYQDNYGGDYDEQTIKNVAAQDLVHQTSVWQVYSKSNPNNIPTFPPFCEPQRDELLEFIVNEKINGVFFFGGDNHYSALTLTGDTTGDILRPITPEGQLFDIVSSAAGSPYNNFVKNRLDIKDQTAFFSDAGTNNHMIIEPDPINYTLKLEFVTEDYTREQTICLDQNYNVQTIKPALCTKLNKNITNPNTKNITNSIVKNNKSIEKKLQKKCRI